jgi:predicted TIM-barrel fold metal-dependent hydrolase
MTKGGEVVKPISAAFDVNASFGNPAGGVPPFPTVASRLAHMDRLGISRALVWNVEAGQHHSLSANRRLLDEVASTLGAPGRIVPALVVSGLIAYEKDGIRKLADQMREGRTRALRFVNVFGLLTLAQCEPVIRAVQTFKPFLLVGGDEASTPDILALTEMFPDVPLILTNLAWVKGIGTFDLMRRRPNVMMETSFWHSWGGVSLAAKQFGAERVLFGTGSRSLNGASMAALARAELTDKERMLIAHGNLDRLTGSDTTPLVTGATQKHSLWRRCLSGEPLGVDMVDAHGHLGPSAGYVLEVQEESDQIPALLHAMDALGQRTMIISGLQALLGSAVVGNRQMADLLKPYADRLLRYLVFNPFYAEGLTPHFDTWFADPQCVGFKILCDYWKIKVTDARFNPMWDYANRHRLPVLIHTWEGEWDSPAMLRDIAGQYPDLSLLLAHCGGTDAGRLEAEAMAAEFPNVFLEWCGSFCSARLWEDTLKTVPAKQVIYGTDAAGHDINWELGRLLSLDVADEILTPILGLNMRRILARRR